MAHAGQEGGLVGPQIGSPLGKLGLLIPTDVAADAAENFLLAEIVAKPGVGRLGTFRVRRGHDGIAPAGAAFVKTPAGVRPSAARSCPKTRGIGRNGRTNISTPARSA